MENYREIVIFLAADSVKHVVEWRLVMRKVLSIALFTLFIGSTAVIACDMGESDNMCKAGQIFDPEKGECRDASV